MIMMILAILAFLSIELRDFFYSLLSFSIFNIMLFSYLLMNGLLYLAIFQLGMFIGTTILIIVMRIGD